jgi:hypothetical protein
MKEVPHVPVLPLSQSNSEPNAPAKSIKKKPKLPQAPPVPPPLPDEIIASMVAQSSEDTRLEQEETDFVHHELIPPQISHRTSGMIPLRDVLASHPKSHTDQTLSAPLSSSIASVNHTILGGGVQSILTEPVNRQAMLRGAAGGLFVLLVLLFLQIR